MLRCNIAPSTLPQTTCMDCGHTVVDHLFPSGVCVICIEVQLARLDTQETLHRRVDQLAFAVQVVSERLDAFVLPWPRREDHHA